MTQNPNVSFTKDSTIVWYGWLKEMSSVNFVTDLL